MDTYPKNQLFCSSAQNWAQHEGVINPDMDNRKVIIDVDNIAEAPRRLALSVSTPRLCEHRLSSREERIPSSTRQVYSNGGVAPGYAIPELLADDAGSAGGVGSGRKREAREEDVAEVVPDDAAEEEEERERDMDGKVVVTHLVVGKKKVGGRVVVISITIICGMVRDRNTARTIRRASQFYSNWMSQAMTYARRRADVEAVALET